MMGNKFDEINQAIAEAKHIFSAADSAARNMANILHGRLHHVPPHILVRLKRELRDFNMHTGQWKK